MTFWSLPRPHKICFQHVAHQCDSAGWTVQGGGSLKCCDWVICLQNDRIKKKKRLLQIQKVNKLTLMFLFIRPFKSILEPNRPPFPHNISCQPNTDFIEHPNLSLICFYYYWYQCKFIYYSFKTMKLSICDRTDEKNIIGLSVSVALLLKWTFLT